MSHYVAKRFKSASADSVWGLYYLSPDKWNSRAVSVLTWGRRYAHNLNVSGALHPPESSVYADFPAESLDAGTWKHAQREVLSRALVNVDEYRLWLYIQG